MWRPYKQGLYKLGRHTDIYGMNTGRFLEEVRSEEARLIEEVREFLRMPSISATGEGIEETARFLRDFIIDRLGGEADLRRYGGHPVVYGRIGSGEKGIYYGMYDVQPVEPLDEWIAPPFEARIVEDRIIARGAFNTKGALMSSLLGLEKYIKSFGEPPGEIHFIIEGEEELGSPSMPKAVEDLKDVLSGARTALFTIPSEFRRGVPSIILGNKGIIYIDLYVKTSKYDIHSSYSRGIVNPAAVLTRIASELIDPLGGPKPDWLYKGFREPTQGELATIDEIMEALPPGRVIEEYGVERVRIDDRRRLVEEIFFHPTVNIDGFCSGYCGEGTKTIIPHDARMKIDFRLVPDMVPEEIVEEFKKMVRDLGLGDLVEIDVRDMYPWSQTPLDSPSTRAAEEVYRDMGLTPKRVLRLPGSAPMYLFTQVLCVDIVSTGPGNGGRAHAPNEYITLDTVWKTAFYTPTYFHRVLRT